MNTGAIDGLRLERLVLVWAWGRSDSTSAVEGCEKLQVQRSEHRHGKHSLFGTLVVLWENQCLSMTQRNYCNIMEV